MFFANYLFHPLNGNGYQFWSGIGSDFGELTLLAVIGTIIHWYINSRCHVGGVGLRGCRKRGHFPFHHYKLCKKHHPDVPDKLTHVHIKKLHKQDNFYEH